MYTIMSVLSSSYLPAVGITQDRLLSLQLPLTDTSAVRHIVVQMKLIDTNLSMGI